LSKKPSQVPPVLQMSQANVTNVWKSQERSHIYFRTFRKQIHFALLQYYSNEPIYYPQHQASL